MIHIMEKRTRNDNEDYMLLTIAIRKNWKACSPVSTTHTWKVWPLLYKSLPCPVVPEEGTAGVRGRARFPAADTLNW